MAQTETHVPLRLAAPSVASVIFAPRPENYTLLSVSTRQRMSEAIALECFVQLDDSVRRRIFDNLRRVVWSDPGVLVDCLHEYANTACTTATLTLPADVVPGQIEAVPARTFPFATHLNLLDSPTEGVFFDPDDFIER